MNKYDIKYWFKSKNKKYWILTGLISAFVILGIVCGIIAMYSCGYTFASWFAKFGWICFIVLALVCVGILGIFFIKSRK